MIDPAAEQKAIWIPAWYELDQSIAVGIFQKFWFFQEKPDCLSLDDDVDLLFFNQLDSSSNSEVRFARIKHIQHKTLGSLARIDTDGLDYIFAPVDGEPIAVNAEEEPGQSYMFDRAIDDWSVLVTLNDISEPLGKVV